MHAFQEGRACACACACRIRTFFLSALRVFGPTNIPCFSLTTSSSGCHWVSRTSLSTSSNVFRTSSSRSNALPSNDASSDDAKPTHKPHTFTLVVVRARLCVHAARKARTAEGVGVWDRQQALVILFSRRGELRCSWLTTSQ